MKDRLHHHQFRGPEKGILPSSRFPLIGEQRQQEPHSEAKDEFRRLYDPEGKIDLEKNWDILKLVFDPGTNRHVRYTHADGRNIITDEHAPAPILTRQAFFTQMERAQDGNKAIAVGLVDIAGFGNADFPASPKDRRSLRSADLLAVQIADSIKKTVRDEMEQLGIQKDTCSYEIGRYGGDEFMVGFFGGITEDQRNTIINKVNEKVHELSGYFLEKGKIAKKPIALKEENHKIVEWYIPPEGKIESRIFFDGIKNGLLYPEEEITKIKESFSLNGTFDSNAYSSIYSPELPELSIRFARLLADHPEFAHLFKSQKLESANDKYLFSIIEKSIYDRLLNDFVYSRTHFLEKIGESGISDVLSVDFKFAKEINAEFSYAETDKVIKDLYKLICSKISNEQRKNIVISRFGTNFYIGIKKQGALSVQEIKNLRSMEVTLKGETFSVPLGVASHKVHRDTIQNPYKIIKQLETESNKSFYEAIFEEAFDTVSRKPDDKAAATGESNPFGQSVKGHLYYLNLRGSKRSPNRQKAFEDALKSSWQRYHEQEMQKVTQETKGKKMSIYQKMNRIQERMDELKDDYNHILTWFKLPASNP